MRNSPFLDVVRILPVRSLQYQRDAVDIQRGKKWSIDPFIKICIKRSYRNDAEKNVGKRSIPKNQLVGLPLLIRNHLPRLNNQEGERFLIRPHEINEKKFINVKFFEKKTTTS